MEDAFIKLASGRVLGYAEYGDPQGTVMFYFHGWPSSRLQGELLDKPAKDRGLRIIAPDRPGIASSDFQPGRTLRDWPPVIEELSAHLGLARFHVMGVSGGGPYVLACARFLPERLLSAGIICGAPPLREVGTEGLLWAYKVALWSQRYLPISLRLGLRFGGWMAGRNYDQWPQRWLTRFYAAKDREALSDPRLFRIMMRSGRVAMLSPFQAVRWDGNLYSSDWGFDLADIEVPVHFWHGDQDGNIPLALAQKAAARIPKARFKTCAGHGHFSLPLLCNAEIISELIGETAVKC